jgi:hypothetical protein
LGKGGFSPGKCITILNVMTRLEFIKKMILEQLVEGGEELAMQLS